MLLKSIRPLQGVDMERYVTLISSADGYAATNSTLGVFPTTIANTVPTLTTLRESRSQPYKALHASADDESVDREIERVSTGKCSDVYGIPLLIFTWKGEVQ